MRTSAKLLLALLPPLVLSACGAQSHTPQFGVSVTLTHLKEQGDWLVTYRASERVDGLLFRRQRDQFRREKWAPVDPEVQLDLVRGQEAIFSRRGKQTEFQIRFKSATDVEAPRDYPFMVPFSDGSAAIYSGHLAVTPLYCPVTAGCGPGEMTERRIDSLNAPMTLVPAKGERVIVGDANSREPLDWSTSYEGSYIYFGNLVPQELPAFRAVVDPNLPTWVFEATRNALPTLFQFYSMKTGFDLNIRPLVFFSFPIRKFSPADYGASGGVLPHQIQLSVSGDQWKNENPENKHKLHELLAHEAAHFWNGDLFRSSGGIGDSWMHEGGADAFAYRALLNLEVITKAEFTDLQTEALNRCLVGLQGKALKDSYTRGLFKNFYYCGSTIGLITEGAIRKNDNHGDLFQFWGQLFRTAAGSGRIYTPAMYEGLLRGYNPKVAARVSQFVNTPLDAADQFMEQVLSDLNIRFQVKTSVLPGWFERELAQKAASYLVNADCGNAQGNFVTSDEFVRVDGTPACKSFKRAYIIESIGSFSLSSQGSQAYDYIYETCKNGTGTLTTHVFNSTEAVTVACQRIPPRPHFISLENLY